MKRAWIMTLGLAACTPSPAPTGATRAAVEAPLVASVDLATSGGPHLIGTPWARVRATLTLGAEAALELETESGVRNVQCPEELRGTSMQGCASEADARALEARVDRARETWRGTATPDGDALALSLRAGERALSLHCRRADGGLDCEVSSGWPAREGFRAPASLSLRRHP